MGPGSAAHHFASLHAAPRPGHEFIMPIMLSVGFLPALENATK
jgi:hypothetical protein